MSPSLGIAVADDEAGCGITTRRRPRTTWARSGSSATGQGDLPSDLDLVGTHGSDLRFCAGASVNEIPSTARNGRADSGTSISPLAQLLKGNRPARPPKARRFDAMSGKRMRIIRLMYRRLSLAARGRPAPRRVGWFKHGTGRDKSFTDVPQPKSPEGDRPRHGHRLSPGRGPWRYDRGRFRRGTRDDHRDHLTARRL